MEDAACRHERQQDSRSEAGRGHAARGHARTGWTRRRARESAAQLLATRARLSALRSRAIGRISNPGFVELADGSEFASRRSDVPALLATVASLADERRSRSRRSRLTDG